MELFVVFGGAFCGVEWGFGIIVDFSVLLFWEGKHSSPHGRGLGGEFCVCFCISRMTNKEIYANDRIDCRL